MANEICFNLGLTGKNLSAVISDITRLNRWNNSTMGLKSDITPANWAVGAIALTQVTASGGAGTGEYTGDIPAGLLSSSLNIDIFYTADITTFTEGGAAPIPIGYQEWPDVRTTLNYLNGTTAIAAASLANVTDTLLDSSAEIDGKTLREAIRYMAAVIAGKATVGTNTVTFKGLDGATARVTADTTPGGDRTSITYDA